MSKKYRVLQYTTYGEWVEVEANSEEEALDKVQGGEWTDEDITESKLIVRDITTDILEVNDE